MNRFNWFRAWDRMSLYIPVLLMGLIALGSFWLLRTVPSIRGAATNAQADSQPDYFLRRFSVKSYDAHDKLKNELFGAEARHYPVGQYIDVDKVRMLLYDDQGQQTELLADRARSNEDGSEVQLFGNASVTREAFKNAKGELQPRMVLKSDYLHIFTNTEKVSSDKPVELIRGGARMTADSLDYNNLDQLAVLKGRVRSVMPVEHPPK